MANLLPEVINPNKLEIPLKIRKASAKILSEYGYTVREISKSVGIDKSTVSRLSHKERGDITGVDSATWDMVQQAVKKMILMKQHQLAAKTLAKIEGKLDEDKAPLGTLAFLYKVLSEANTPKNETNLNMQGSQIAVQVIRGNVSYSSTSKAITPNTEAK